MTVSSGSVTATASGLTGVNSFTLAWSIASQDNTNNTTTIAFTVTAGGGSSYYRRIKSIKVYFKNTNSSGWDYTLSPSYNELTYGGTVMVPSTSFALANNSDGTLNITYQATTQFWNGNTSSYVTANTGTQTAELTAIPMQSALTVTPLLLTSGNLTITLTRAVSTYLDEVFVKVNGTTLYTYQLTASDYTDDVATITKAYADIVADSGLATGLTATITVQSKTYENSSYSTQVGSTQTVTVTLSTGAIPLSLYYKSNRYGVAIGKRATATDILDIAYDTNIDGTITALTEEATLSPSRTSGASTLTAHEYKFGKVVTITFTCTFTGTTSAGSNVWVGNIGTSHLPPANITDATYNGSRILAYSLASDGTFTIRTNSQVGTGQTSISGSITYVIV